MRRLIFYNLCSSVLLCTYIKALYSLSQDSYSNSLLVCIPTLRSADLELRDDFTYSSLSVNIHGRPIFRAETSSKSTVFAASSFFAIRWIVAREEP
ncbi:putative MutS protein [Fusarium oxysporum f. sp. albedinis]|nr:putative MutS protein [Fusarium oxysporum f. sp. albedinis]